MTKAYVYTTESNAPVDTITITSTKDCEHLQELAAQLFEQHGPCIVRDVHLQSIMQVVGDSEYVYG